MKPATSIKVAYWSALSNKRKLIDCDGTLYYVVRNECSFDSDYLRNGETRLINIQ